MHALHGVSVAELVRSTEAEEGYCATSKLWLGVSEKEAVCVRRTYKSSPNLTSRMRKDKSPPGTRSSASEGLNVLVTPVNWLPSSDSAKGRLKLSAVAPQEHM